MNNKKRFVKRIICTLLLIVLMTPLKQVNASSEAGNTPGNLHNGGEVVEEGDWIYYKEYDFLCKTKKDGTETKYVLKKETDGIHGLNIEGDWLYYTRCYYEKGDCYNRLCRIKLDGTGNEKICSSNVSAYGTPTVQNGWIYFSDDENLCKIKVDGSKKKILLKDWVYDFCVSGKWIYYVCDKSVCRMKINGKSKKKLKKSSEELTDIQIYKDWIYYQDFSENLYRMKLNGRNHKKILKNVMSFNVTDGKLYYSIRDKATRIADLNGKNTKRLFKDDLISIYVLKNDIYGVTIKDHVRYWYKLKKDGSHAEFGWSYWEGDGEDT